jgi:hypothetical protein
MGRTGCCSSRFSEGFFFVLRCGAVLFLFTFLYRFNMPVPPTEGLWIWVAFDVIAKGHLV